MYIKEFLLFYLQIAPIDRRDLKVGNVVKKNNKICGLGIF